MKIIFIFILSLLVTISFATAKSNITGKVEMFRCYDNPDFNDGRCGFVIIDSKADKRLAFVDTELPGRSVDPALWEKFDLLETQFNSEQKNLSIKIPVDNYWKLDENELYDMEDRVNYYLRLNPDIYYYCDMKEMLNVLEQN